MVHRRALKHEILDVEDNTEPLSKLSLSQYSETGCRACLKRRTIEVHPLPIPVR